jgi:hypothetical protein
MNVLLEPWDTPFGLPPFSRIEDKDFGPAFDQLGLIEAEAHGPLPWVHCGAVHLRMLSRTGPGQARVRLGA